MNKSKSIMTFILALCFLAGCGSSSSNSEVSALKEQIVALQSENAALKSAASGGEQTTSSTNAPVTNESNSSIIPLYNQIVMESADSDYEVSLVTKNGNTYSWGNRSTLPVKIDVGKPINFMLSNLVFYKDNTVKWREKETDTDITTFSDATILNGYSKWSMIDPQTAFVWVDNDHTKAAIYRFTNGGKTQVEPFSTTDNTSNIDIQNSDNIVKLVGAVHPVTDTKYYMLVADGRVLEFTFKDDSLGHAPTAITVVNDPNITDVKDLAMPNYQYYIVFVKNNGTVWNKGQGNLGIADITNSDVPVQVPGLNDIVEVSADKNNSYALKSDGTVYAWGSEYAGFGVTPVQVEGLSNIIYIQAGYAIDKNGNVWAWGNNENGTYGDGTRSKGGTVPVQVKNPDGTGYLNYFTD